MAGKGNGKSFRETREFQESLWPMPTAQELEALRKEPQTFAIFQDAGNGQIELEGNLPQCLGGLIENWEARSWSREYWIRYFGHLKFRLRPCTSLHRYGYAGPAERLVSLEEYLSSTFKQSFVLFENDFDAERLEVLGSFAVPECLARIHGAPIFSVGRQDTGVGFHRHSAAWLAQLLGRKLWLLLPGGKRPPERPPWQYLIHRPQGMRCVVAHPGEIVYVPAGWWHATWNLDDVCLAAGWEKGSSTSWGPEMHAIVDGDAARVRSMNFRVTVPALSLAARSGRTEILELLLQRSETDLHKDAPSIAIAAARSGHVAILSQLWKNGITTCIQSSRISGSTALHEAARCGRLEVLQWLLFHQADCQQIDRDGDEALQVAAEFGHPFVVEALLHHGAQVDGRNAKGLSALMLSAWRGHSAVVELLSHRSNVDLRDVKGRAALHHAAIGGHHLVANRLLRASAEVDGHDTCGRTPLHLATLGLNERDATSEKIVSLEDSRLQLVRILLDASADVDLLDDLGKSPLDYAAIRNMGTQTLRELKKVSDEKKAKFVATHEVSLKIYEKICNTKL